MIADTIMSSIVFIAPIAPPRVFARHSNRRVGRCSRAFRRRRYAEDHRTTLSSGLGVTSGVLRTLPAMAPVPGTGAAAIAPVPAPPAPGESVALPVSRAKASSAARTQSVCALPLIPPHCCSASCRRCCACALTELLLSPTPPLPVVGAAPKVGLVVPKLGLLVPNEGFVVLLGNVGTVVDGKVVDGTVVEGTVVDGADAAGAPRAPAPAAPGAAAAAPEPAVCASTGNAAAHAAARR